MDPVVTTGPALPDVFTMARDCLAARETALKVALTRTAVQAWKDGCLGGGAGAAHASGGPAGQPARSAQGGEVPPLVPGLPAAVKLVDPRSVPRRRLGSERGRAAFVHAIAHIELNAVNLAWDCVYRFRGMPRQYYDDWVRVAGEEAEHFELLRTRLEELGHGYGDFEAHEGLWEMAAETAGDLLARMAMVPRVLEARGLDVTPGLIDRLSRAGDEGTVRILRIILEEEVSHVAVGSRWFGYECERRGLDPEPTFMALVEQYAGGSVKPPLNLDARRRAGFTSRELDMLERLTRQGPRG
jgi:uncharacterized ferritin-like protein (DUF455 family)